MQNRQYFPPATDSSQDDAIAAASDNVLTPEQGAGEDPALPDVPTTEPTELEQPQPNKRKVDNEVKEDT